jgi:hypothetical protein
MALTPQEIADLQASAALMQQRIQAASDPNRNAAFDKYVADQAAKGVEVASTYTGGGGPLGSGGVLGVTDFAPAFDPANPAGTTGQVVRFDPGRMNAPVVFQPGQQYVLTDASGENVVGRASSVEELQKLADAQGNMPYGFQLYQADQQGNYKPGTQLFGETDPRTKGLMGAIVNYGLPIAVGAVTGGASLLPAMAASAAASGASKLMTGYTAEDAAKAAAIAGATRGVFKGTGLEEGLSGLLSGTDSVVGNAVNPGFYVPGTVIPKFVAPTLSGLGSTLGTLAAAPVAGEILVQGARNAVSPALASAITGGLTSLAPAVFDPSSIPQFQSPDVSNAETSQQSDYQPGDDAPIVVTAQSPLNIGGALAPVAGAATPTGGNLDYLNKVIQEEIDTDTVTGKRPIIDKIITGALGAAGLGAIANTVGASGKPATTGDKIQTGLTGAALLAGAVGGGGGGGGPPDLGTGYTVPGAGSGIGRTRNVATFDPFTYGQREGEFQFFNTGPASAPAPSRFSAEPIMQSTGGLLGALNNPTMLQNLQEAMAAEPAFNAAASTGMAEGGEVDDDMVSHLIAYRKGGGHMGPGKVKGIGSGQDDKIPAWLSDGEYVWSAQDVADLGDGSTDEGVRRLDKMRQMVRKGAGRKDVKKIAKPQRGIEDMLKAVGGAV